MVAGLVAGAWFFQDRLIYLPSGTAGSPRDAGLDGAVEVPLVTEDDLRLEAWFVPAADEGSTTAVLMLPGNAGNRSLRAPLARALSEAGLAALLVEYRGYGGNPGSPSEAGLAADARAAYAYLSQRDDIDQIVVFGESLGAAVAVSLARDVDVHALVLRSPFTSLADVGRLHYPFLPVGLLLRDRFEVVEAIAGVDTPVVVVAGDRDTIVPLEQSRRVAEAADAELVVVPSAGHNDAALGAGDVLVDAIAGVAR